MAVRTTTTRTTVVTSTNSVGPSSPQIGNRSYTSTAGRSGGGRTGPAAKTTTTHRTGGTRGGGVRSSRGGGGGGCNCGGNGGGCLAAVSHWLALAAAITIIVAWGLRFFGAEKKFEKPSAWFEFLLLIFLCLMIILGGFGIGGLDSFLEEYLQLTISCLGKGMLLAIFCFRVYFDKWDFFKGSTDSRNVCDGLASLLCVCAGVLAILVLFVGLGVAK